MQVWRMTGKKPKELDELSEMPDSCVHVWEMFIDLHNARQSGGFAVNPLSWSCIKSYFDLHKIDPELWEIHLIKKFDRIALEHFAKEAEKQTKQTETKSKRK